MNLVQTRLNMFYLVNCYYRTCSECYLYTIFEEPGNLKSDDNNGELLYFRENESKIFLSFYN